MWEEFCVDEDAIDPIDESRDSTDPTDDVSSTSAINRSCCSLKLRSFSDELWLLMMLLILSVHMVQ